MKRFHRYVLLSGLLAALGMAHAEERTTMAFVGDVMLAETEGTGQWIAQGGDPFIHVRPMLRQAALRVANFESSAGHSGKPDPEKPYSFRTSPDAVKMFASLFQVAGLANNHAGDYGRQDFLETLATLQQAGSTSFGGGRDLATAHRALRFEHHGIRIALLGYLDFFPRWFTATPEHAGVAWLDTDQAAIDIENARVEGADIVMVIPHWGVEYEPFANPRQHRLARALIDAGADAVIGGHPHVVQDTEVYRGKPIVYSLGNFVFDGFDDDASRTGWVLFVDMDRQGIASLRTQVVTLESRGLPVPDPNKTGPCWHRGDAAMLPCPATPVQSPNAQSTDQPAMTRSVR